MLDAERERRLAEIFRRALDVPPASRAVFLESHCGDDAELRARVEALLAEEARGTAGILGADLLGKAPPEERRIGPYRLLEILGEGGMGTVYLAEQAEPVRRRVALKTIRLGMATEEVLRRFAAERQALARMNHPNIAEIYEAGSSASGLPWFAMEHCPGPRLDAYADGARLRIAERLSLLLPVCDAVQHAHQKGVIHRDLKPANVLVTQQDGRPVPKIIDFGVARAIAGDFLVASLQTAPGSPIGTWLYMSPEQADGKGDVDTRADVWALGATLYGLLAGGTPFQADTVPAIFRAITSEDPVAPSRRVRALSPDDAKRVARARRSTPEALARRLAGDLDAIVLKALERDRSRRYAAASELAADLRRHLAREPVSARRPTLAYQTWAFVRRNRTAVSLLAVAILAVLVGLAGAWRGERRARMAEEARKRIAERRLDEGFARSRFLEHAFFVGGDLPLSRLLEEAEADVPVLCRDRPGDEAAVRYSLGVAWLDLGRPEKARPHLERSYALLTRTLGRDATADVFLALDALVRSARQAGAEPDPDRLERSLELAVILARESDPDLGRALGTIVDMRREAFPSSAEATARLEDVSRALERGAGRREAALYVARVLAETAISLLRGGRAEEGIAYSRAVERVALASLEPRSTGRLMFLVRFARLHLAGGIGERAGELAARILEETEGLLSEDHWLRAEARRIGEAASTPGIPPAK